MEVADYWVVLLVWLSVYEEYCFVLLINAEHECYLCSTVLEPFFF